MLYLFDIDGTVVSSYMENPDKDYHKWEVLPNRREKIAELLAEGHTIGIVTNQASVAFGFVTVSVVEKRLAKIIEAAGLPEDTPIKVCYYHPKARLYKWRDAEGAKRRKPSGAMILEHISENPAAAAEGVIYVGDRPEDKAAALDAGVQFRWEQDFFA